MGLELQLVCVGQDGLAMCHLMQWPPHSWYCMPLAGLLPRALCADSRGVPGVCVPASMWAVARCMIPAGMAGSCREGGPRRLCFLGPGEWGGSSSSSSSFLPDGGGSAGGSCPSCRKWSWARCARCCHCSDCDAGFPDCLNNFRPGHDVGIAGAGHVAHLQHASDNMSSCGWRIPAGYEP